MRIYSHKGGVALLAGGLGILGIAFLAIENLHPNPPAETVLREGTRLIAKTSSGVITIVAGNGLERKYEWNECALTATMEARKSRWFGSLGINDGAGSFEILSSVFPQWFKCKGISRTVVEEGQIHFKSKVDAENWIAVYAMHYPTVWSDDGLVVDWELTAAREQINVELRQICIAGKRPHGLRGATDQAIRIVPETGSPSGLQDCSSVSDEVMKTTLNDWAHWWKELE